MLAKITIIVVLALLCCNVVHMFSVSRPFQVLSSRRALFMGGGRNKLEVGLSKRQMFQQVKQKLNTEALTPGFFETDGHAEVQLYAKSNSDGKQIGDCPFAQFLQMVLLKKGIKYDLLPTHASNKPAWLVEKHNGQLPVLVHKDEAITESLLIAEHIEKAYPHNSLTRQGAYSYQEVLEKTAGFFPALKAVLLNKDAASEEALFATLNTQLDALDELLRSTPGQFLGGIELTLADLYLLPQLFHGVIALDHFKGFEFYHMDAEFTRPALENYVQRMLKLEEFNNKRAYVSADQIIYGWKVARGEA